MSLGKVDDYLEHVDALYAIQLKMHSPCANQTYDSIEQST